MPTGLAAGPQGDGLVVRSGDDRLGRPMDIAGWRFECKISRQDTAGAFCVYDTTRRVKGGPPLHVHRSQDEWFYVRSGEFLFRVGDRTLRFRSGDSLLGPRGAPHAFAALSDASALIVAFHPAGSIERLFEAAYALSLSQVLGLADWHEIAAPHDVEIVGPPLQLA